ncbi:hypothetical protein Theco_4084 (plasmid) [Thermobacillus composti KWC4]|uniref:Uncharacterized protein n=1 Tax=Thermobacillus composti (strain DSM 18247 / JCM 13945 / KWC4) TaxID=717605 RepID=L0EIK7_THECK|nr:hypothetical protein [Thermobacillus composti]AGA60083.1 hypothetical protein Theco_4084 [Thermobacillus composti KWC4]
MGLFYWLFKNKNTKKSGRYPGIGFSAYAPDNLGFKPNVYLTQIEKRFNEVFEKHSDYLHNLRTRVLSNHEDITAEMYSWLLLEFKRFLCMNIFLKNVGMYSSHTDLVWHEALMFTMQYQRLCEDLIGEMIHHHPHVDGSAQPNEHQRALFEIVYSTIFNIYPENIFLLGRFGRCKLDQRFVDHVLSFDPTFVIHHYFKTNDIDIFAEAVEDTVRQIGKVLRDKAKQERSQELSSPIPIIKSEQRSAPTIKSRRSVPGAASNIRSNQAQQNSSSDSTLNTILMLSLLSDDDNNRSGGGSSCSGSTCSSSSDGSSCSSSSCSSSSCSSSSCSSGCSS